VHPGYGFLSERASFCAALEAEGIVFIGPKPKAIARHGRQDRVEEGANEAKVSTVPGISAIIEDADHAETIADEIGYPVMIKASAGGGGKGMRIAHSKAEVRDGFDRAGPRRRASFGDDRVFIEKFIVDPASHRDPGPRPTSTATYALSRRARMLDPAPQPEGRRGGAVAVARRDDPAQAMGEQAVALAKAVDYESAGTVEFIVDRDKFYFLEMNTRLQVEHPVTELVTGIDLVEQMIRVAAGERLALEAEGRQG
jgi:propionyl-CoA carboxylase alpha chain